MAAKIFEILLLESIVKTETFLRKHPDQINELDENGQSPFLAAVSYRKPAIASMLLNLFGANINAVNIAGQTAMDIAVANNDAAMINLLETQIQLNAFLAEHNGDKSQALINAVVTGNKKFIPHLIAGDADLNARDIEGKTALMHAVAFGDIDTAARLFRATNIETPDNNGNTAFMIATARMDREMMLFLLKNKANDSAVNHDGKTAVTTIEDEEKRAEIADFITEQKLLFSLFSTLSIDKTSLEEGSENRVTQTYDSQSPRYSGALILAEYYKLKYGIKIAVLGKDASPDEILDFVKNQSEADFQFGVIRYGSSHNVGNVFEKSGNEISFVSLDSSPSYREQKFSLEAMRQIPDLQIFSPSEHIELQVDGRCATHAFSMTKDALRLQSTTQEFERAATIISTENGVTTFSKFPPKLLKYAETSRSVQDVDQEESVLRSSADKPEMSLSDYRSKHLKTEVVKKKGKEELRPERNFRIYDKGLEFLEKVKKVLDFYEVDQSKLPEFVARLKQSQTDSLANGTFANPVTTQEELNQQTKLHSDHLGSTPKDIPTWSRVGTPKQTSRPTSAIPLSKIGREAEISGAWNG